ncbi:MAG TPA: hypothetical protein VLA21_07215, partial [Candidatus Limnocylindria bacterium]|nr:hypothetical protein [Candidatus Limnocylindria bacterium]
MTHKSWLSGAAVLRRNYSDLTFCPQNVAPDLAESKQRTLARLGPALDRFKVYHSGTYSAETAPYADAGLLPTEFDKLTEAAFLANDEERIYVTLNAEEHVVIQARGPADRLESLAAKARGMEETLRDPQHPFAFHERFGFLSYRPQLSGSGLYLTLTLHLPMLSFIKQIRRQDSVMDEYGCELKPLGGNPSFNPSRLFTLTNASSQGMDDRQVLEAVLASGEALDAKE